MQYQNTKDKPQEKEDNMTYEVYANHKKHEQAVENDLGEIVTFNPSMLIVKTDDKDTVQKAIQWAESEGYTDIVTYEYDPNTYEKPDFAKVF